MGPLLASLTLFPPHSLDTSILAAVLIGVIVLALLTETLGWVFVGLVVPGYLASVFIIHPEAGFTVTAEAILTYLLALALARGVSATGAWSEFFGRERFFLIVICSVLVRAVSEVVLLPRIGVWLDASFGTTFTVDRSLHSIGLVLVPLTANAFWKVGLRRGAFQVGVPVVITLAVVWWLLLPFTNLSFTSLELTYEDVAQRFLASPKAYIILLTTALIAARFNLRYGWDFNGILVAALVALTWLGPAKLVATLAEVVVLVVGIRALLSLPAFRTLNLEGPRKTVLVFAFGFLLKFAIGWLLGGRIPGLKVTDLFGFGYLVPTLLAVKILQKQVTARVLLPTVQTSLAGVVLGSLAGFILSFAEPRKADASNDAPPPTTQRLQRSPLGAMALAHATCRENDTGQLPLRLRRSELRQWEQMWGALDEWLVTRDGERLAEANRFAAGLGLRLERADGDADRAAWVLFESPEREPMGWGASVLFPGAPGPVLLVPRPASEAPSAEAAAILCERVQCRALIASGVDTHRAGIERGDALAERATPLRRADAVLDDRPRLLIRADASLKRGRPVLHASTGAGAQNLWPGAEVSPPDAILAWDDDELAVLRAHPEDLRALVVEAAPQVASVAFEAAVARLLSADVRAATPRRVLSRAELLVLEGQVAAPLLAEAGPTDGDLRWAGAMASLIGLGVERVEGCGPACFAVSDASFFESVGAGAWIRSRGAAVAVEVPSPAVERGTLPIGLEMWRAANARALLFADASAEAPQGVPHAAAPGALETPFQALHQAVNRALPAPEGVVLQVRGYSARPGVSDDVLVTLDGAAGAVPADAEPLTRLWTRAGPLAWLGDRVRFHDGAPELAGLTTPSPQQVYSRTFEGPRVASLWLPQHVRGAFVAPRAVGEWLQLSRLPTPPFAPRSPADALLDGLAAPERPPSRALQQRFDALATAASRFIRQRGIRDLGGLAEVARRGTRGATVKLYEATAEGLPYLLVEAREGRSVLRGVWFLQDVLPGGEPRLHAAGASGVERAVAQAVRRRAPIKVRGEAAKGARP